MERRTRSTSGPIVVAKKRKSDTQESVQKSPAKKVAVRQEQEKKPVADTPREEEQHRERKTKCRLCNNVFTGWKSFCAHSCNDGQLHCSDCDRVFPNATGLAQHKCSAIKLNQIEKPYSCPMCSASFSKELYLDTHLESHGLKKFDCPSCDKSYSRKSHLNIHLTKSHRELFKPTAEQK